MYNTVVIQLSPAVAKRVSFESAWKEVSPAEVIETLVLEALRARDAKEAATASRH